MNSLDSVKLRADFSATVNRVAFGKERITLTRRGKKVAVLVPVEDARLLEELEDARDLRDALKALKEKGGKTLAQLRKELGL
jgi:prevent-host-death family protein